MAQPIALELPHRDPREELRARLENAPIEHAAAVLSGYELLQGLHDRGVLELLRAAVGSGDKLVETAVEAARTPEAIRGMRNVLILAKMMGSIEPESKKFCRGLSGSSERSESTRRAAAGTLVALERIPEQRWPPRPGRSEQSAQSLGEKHGGPESTSSGLGVSAGHGTDRGTDHGTAWEV